MVFWGHYHQGARSKEVERVGASWGGEQYSLVLGRFSLAALLLSALFFFLSLFTFYF